MNKTVGALTAPRSTAIVVRVCAKKACEAHNTRFWNAFHLAQFEKQENQSEYSDVNSFSLEYCVYCLCSPGMC